jgi:endonuclease III
MSLHQAGHRDTFRPVDIEETIALLEREYGPAEWRRDEDPVDVLIRTVLSQNTSDINSDRAFGCLKAGFGSWDAVASAPVESIASAIQSGGLFRIKAGRIKQLLRQIEHDQGGIDLGSLRHSTMADAESYLMSLPGIGHKTARCVLLFSLGMPSLPVDTHIFRVAMRLGLLDAKTSIEKAHVLLQDRIPPSQVYQFHVHMIEHGRRVCRSRHPMCDRCVLRIGCPGSAG